MNSGIVMDKGILGGRPRISGTRIGVHHIANYIAAGYGIDEIQHDYPQLTQDEIGVALTYLYDQTGREIRQLQTTTV